MLSSLALVALAAVLATDPSGVERALFSAAQRGDAPVLRRLLREGAPATVRGERGRTPLHDAAAAGRAEIVRILLAAGADPGATEKTGFTPLMDAVRAGKIEVVEALLEAGADPSARDRAAGTALDVAQQNGREDIATLLRSRSAKGSGKSVGDRVCVRRWKGAGFCGTVAAARPGRYRITVTSLVGCAEGCEPDPDCTEGRPVGGDSADAIVSGTSVWTAGSCLTHTGLE